MDFRQYLIELFDKPWKKEKDEHASLFYTHDVPNHYPGHKITNVSAYKLEGDNGHLLSFHRNGVLEAHHIDKNGVSGSMHKNASKPNPRFYSTLIHHLKTEGLDKGHSVKISTTNEKQHAHYKKLVDKKFSKDNEVMHYDEEINGHKIHTSHIRPANKLVEGIVRRYEQYKRMNNI